MSAISLLKYISELISSYCRVAIRYQSKMEHGTATTTFMVALYNMISILRPAIQTRLAAWPYNSAAQSPYIQPPRAAHISMNPGFSPPIPFTGSRAWTRWYESYNETLFCTPNYFTDGPWVGYYTSFDSHARQLDPPMIDINFRVVPTPSWRPDELTLQADGCRDGIGPFSITGGFTHSREDWTGEVEFTAAKQYRNARTRWLWDLRVTPFGFVGFWGTDELGHYPHTEIKRLGLVWLWKDAWTKDESE